MKLGLFTDPHYSSVELTCGNRRNRLSLAKIREAMAFFEAEGCDLALCLGDLIDREPEHAREIENLRQVSEAVHAFSVPFVSMMGNHDAFSFSVDEFYGILGEDCRPRDRRFGEKQLIFLDACYFQSGKHYQPGDTDWTDTCYPYPERLQKKLAEAETEAVVFLHQNIDPEIHPSHLLSNAAQLRSLCEDSGKVRTVLQGHYHEGHCTVCHGISYVTLPAMCQGECRRWTAEL